MRYITTVRGTLKDPATAQQVHDATVAAVSPLSRSKGAVSHQPYLNVQNAGEFLAVDVWNNLESLQELYSDPKLAEEFGKLFEGQPQVTIWSDSG